MTKKNTASSPKQGQKQGSKPNQKQSQKQNHEHEHEHDDDDRFITLIGEDGSEELFEILLTIDGTEEFGKNYVLLIPSGTADDEEIDVQVFSYTQNETGTEGDLEPVPEDSEDEWAMIEDIYNQFVEGQAQEGETEVK